MQESLSQSEVRKLANGDFVPKRPMKQATTFKSRDNSKYGKRHKTGVMNQTEESFAALLRARELAGEVVQWHFEAVTFKLANDCRFTPDFCVQLADGSMEFIDCKGAGPMDPKSRVKIRCAAEKWPQFTFAIEQKQNKKKGGGWKRENF